MDDATRMDKLLNVMMAESGKDSIVGRTLKSKTKELTVINGADITNTTINWVTNQLFKLLTDILSEVFHLSVINRCNFLIRLWKFILAIEKPSKPVQVRHHPAVRPIFEEQSAIKIDTDKHPSILRSKIP